MFCRKCNTLMKHVMSFEKGKAVEFERCPKCNAESKANPFKYRTTKTEKDKTRNCSPLNNGRKSNVLCLHNNNQRVKKA